MTGRLLEVKGIQAEAYKGEYSVGEIIFPDTMNSLVIGTDAFKDCVATLYMTQKLYDNLVEQGRIQDNKIDDATIQIYDEEKKTITLRKSTITEHGQVIDIFTDINNGVIYTAYGVLNGVRYLLLSSLPQNTNITSYPELEAINLEIVFEDEPNVVGKIVTIMNSVFLNQKNFELKRLPNTILYYSNSAFEGCTKLSLNVIPMASNTSVCFISTNAFKDCTSLNVPTIYSNSIGVSSFENTGLTNLHIYSMSILSDAFANCSNLKTVSFHDMPSRDENKQIMIRGGAFRNCTKLESVSFLDATSIVVFNNSNIFENCLKCKVYLKESDFKYNQSVIDTENMKIGSASVIVDNSLVINSTLYDDVYRGSYEYYNESLKELTFVDSIQLYAPLNTKNLEITILSPNGERIRGYTLVSLKEKSLTINNYTYLPDTIRYIGNSVSYGSMALRTLPKNIISIGKEAFKNSPAMTLYELETLDYLEEIQESAFEGCINLTPLTISSNSKLIIGKNAFKDCSSLNPSTITAEEIQESAFENCSGLTECTINSIDSLTIRTSAFKNCNSLTSLVLSTETINIEAGSFVGASSCIIKMNPEARQKLIDQGIIVNNKIDDATVESSAVIELNSELKDANNILYKVLGAGIIAINSGTAMTTTEYVPIENASYKYNDELYSLTTIGSSAFSNHKTITNAEIPSPVSSIENDAFRGCTALTTVKIPNTVNTIGNYAFSGSGLVSVTIPKEVNSLGTYLFSACSNLSSITIEAGSNISSIPDSCFMGCSSLKTLNIPSSLISSLTSIGNNSFNGSGIVQFPVPSNVKTIGQGAFKDCTSLTSVTLPTNSNYKNIEINLFNGCNNLTSIVIPSNVEVIETNAFTNTAISNLIIPDSVYVLEPNAFAMCNLQYVTIGSFMDTIEEGCFSDCPNLLQVKFKQNDNMTLKLNENTFKNSFPMQKKINDISVITYVDVSKTMINEVRSNCFANTGLLVFVPGKITHEILPYAFKDSAVCLIDFTLNHDGSEYDHHYVRFYEESINKEFVHVFVNSETAGIYDGEFTYMFVNDDIYAIGSRVFEIGGESILLDAYGNTYRFRDEQLITLNISNENADNYLRKYAVGIDKTQPLQYYSLAVIGSDSIKGNVFFVAPETIRFIESNCLSYDTVTKTCDASIDVSYINNETLIEILGSDDFKFVPDDVNCSGSIRMNQNQANVLNVSTGSIFKKLSVLVNNW